MRNRILVTEGQGKFVETLWDKPNIGHREISVKAIMTGICRSDIDMMNGDFGPLPIFMQGHEGLGKVTKVGASVMNVKVGDIVQVFKNDAVSAITTSQNPRLVLDLPASDKIQTNIYFLNL